MRNDEENPKVGRDQYQRLVGKFIYLTHTRLDLPYVVSIISQFMYDPRVEHLQGMEKILQYIKTTPERGLLLHRGENLSLEVYADADM